jgi:hypothetical protein
MIVIKREYKDKCTLGDGSITMNGKTYKFKTLELPWKNNERRVSCIPEGEYFAIKHSSPKFKECLWIQNVPSRSEILIHTGNFTRQILGCILPGTSHADIDKDGITDVTESRVAMNNILNVMGSNQLVKVIIS